MEFAELEDQARRVRAGEKLASELKVLQAEYERIKVTRSISLYSVSNGHIASVGYGSSTDAQDWNFTFMTIKEIAEVMDIVRNAMLSATQRKIDGLRAEFAKI